MAAASGGIRADAFERLRRQFKERRGAYLEGLAEAMCQVDVSAFGAGDEAHGGHSAAPSFELCGALPPTSASRLPSVPAMAAIVRRDKEAAKTLIERQAQADRTAREQLFRDVHAGRASTAPSRSLAASDDFPEDPDGPATPSACSTVGEGFTVTDGGILVRRKGTGEDWEQKMSEHYRQAEVARDTALALATLELREKAQLEQRRYVSEMNFERKFKRREKAIISDSQCIRQRHLCTEAKEAFQARLEESYAIRDREVAEHRRRAQDEKRQSHEKKQWNNAHRHFLVRHCVLDKTCRAVDVQIAKEKRKQELLARTDMKRRDGEVWARQMDTRQVMKEAHKRARAVDDRERLAYLTKHRQDMEQRHHEQLKATVRAQHAFDRYMGEAKAEITGGYQFAPRMEELLSYDDTLQDFRELADDMHRTRRQIQAGDFSPDSGRQLLLDAGAVSPEAVVLPLEPQIRAALGLHPQSEAFDEEGETEDEEPDAGLTWRLPRVSASLPPEEGPALAAPRPAAALREAVAPVPPVVEAQLQRRERFGTPQDLPRSQAALRSSFGRWATAGAVGARAATAPHSARTGREPASLSALRMIRRTGPLGGTR